MLHATLSPDSSTGHSSGLQGRGRDRRSQFLVHLPYRARTLLPLLSALGFPPRAATPTRMTAHSPPRLYSRAPSPCPLVGAAGAKAKALVDRGFCSLGACLGHFLGAILRACFLTPATLCKPLALQQFFRLRVFQHPVRNEGTKTLSAQWNSRSM